MSYYIFIENGQISGCGQLPTATVGIISHEVTEAQYNAFNENPDCYVLADGVPTLDQNLLSAKNIAKLLEEAKIVRADAVDAIVVEVDGMQFDGDEDAQRRMTVAISTARGLADIENKLNPPVPVDYLTLTTQWVLATNTIAIVTIEQLVKACSMAGIAQTQLWTVPYE